jgi:hypothetical protein
MENGDIQLAIQMLLDEAEGEFDDPYALHLRIEETIRTLQSEGMPVPDDLIALKRDLETVMGGPTTEWSDGEKKDQKPDNPPGGYRE